jgi:hypothetical protein
MNTNGVVEDSLDRRAVVRWHKAYSVYREPTIGDFQKFVLASTWEAFPAHSE